MLRILMGILAISLFSECVTAQLPRGFSDVKKALDVNMEQYQKIARMGNSTITKEYARKLLRNVTQSSSELHALDIGMNVTCADLLRPLYVDNKLDHDLQSSMEDLCHTIKKIDRFFEDSRKFAFDELYSNETFQTFAYELLWGDINLPDTLEDLYELFSSGMFGSGLLSRIQQRSLQVYQDDCDIHFSTQQQILYIYLQLVIAELKGLITTQLIYLTKRQSNDNSDTYIAEIQYAEKNYASRLNDYHLQFTQLADLYPQYIRRCDVEKPDYGVNIIELERFSRFVLLDQELDHNFSCKSCPSETEIEKISLTTHATMYNCTAIGPVVAACRADPGSSRDYMWWQDNNGDLYGRNTTCGVTEYLHGRHQTSHIPYRSNFPRACALCACSADRNEAKKDDNSTIWRISVTAQISDLGNNMIVTGVKFVKYDNAIHLQIRQSNFTHSGIIHTDGGWKPLKMMLYDRGFTQTEGLMSYEPLRYDRKSLNLDDMVAPQNMVVTGVRFIPDGNTAFKSQIYVSDFDFETGVVSPLGGAWIDASTNPMRPGDYERKRIEINLDNSDDPTRAPHFKYDIESNKRIKFTHTDIHKDAGQTTIPLLDSQPVVTRPPFPLGGIGLSYKGSDGFGGYVAPRIYTMDITKYLYSLHDSPDDLISATRNPFSRDSDNDV